MSTHTNIRSIAEYIANRVIEYLKENDDAHKSLNEQNDKLERCGIMMCEICEEYCDKYERQKEHCKKCFTRMCNKCYTVCTDCGYAYCSEGCIEYYTCNMCINIMCKNCFDNGVGLCCECERERVY